MKGTVYPQRMRPVKAYGTKNEGSEGRIPAAEGTPHDDGIKAGMSAKFGLIENMAGEAEDETGE